MWIVFGNMIHEFSDLIFFSLKEGKNKISIVNTIRLRILLNHYTHRIYTKLIATTIVQSLYCGSC